MAVLDSRRFFADVDAANARKTARFLANNPAPPKRTLLPNQVQGPPGLQELRKVAQPKPAPAPERPEDYIDTGPGDFAQPTPEEYPKAAPAPLSYWGDYTPKPVDPNDPPAVQLAKSIKERGEQAIQHISDKGEVERARQRAINRLGSGLAGAPAASPIARAIAWLTEPANSPNKAKRAEALKAAKWYDSDAGKAHFRQHPEDVAAMNSDAVGTWKSIKAGFKPVAAPVTQQQVSPLPHGADVGGGVRTSTIDSATGKPSVSMLLPGVPQPPRPKQLSSLGAGTRNIIGSSGDDTVGVGRGGLNIISPAHAATAPTQRVLITEAAVRATGAVESSSGLQMRNLKSSSSGYMGVTDATALGPQWGIKPAVRKKGETQEQWDLKKDRVGRDMVKELIKAYPNRPNLWALGYHNGRGVADAYYKNGGDLSRAIGKYFRKRKGETEAAQAKRFGADIRAAQNHMDKYVAAYKPPPQQVAQLQPASSARPIGVPSQGYPAKSPDMIRQVPSRFSQQVVPEDYIDTESETLFDPTPVPDLGVDAFPPDAFDPDPNQIATNWPYPIAPAPAVVPPPFTSSARPIGVQPVPPQGYPAKSPDMIRQVPSRFSQQPPPPAPPRPVFGPPVAAPGSIFSNLPAPNPYMSYPDRVAMENLPPAGLDVPGMTSAEQRAIEIDRANYLSGMGNAPIPPPVTTGGYGQAMLGVGGDPPVDTELAALGEGPDEDLPVTPSGMRLPLGGMPVEELAALGEGEDRPDIPSGMRLPLGASAPVPTQVVTDAPPAQVAEAVAEKPKIEARIEAITKPPAAGVVGQRTVAQTVATGSLPASVPTGIPGAENLELQQAVDIRNELRALARVQAITGDGIGLAKTLAKIDSQTTVANHFAQKKAVNMFDATGDSRLLVRQWNARHPGSNFQLVPRSDGKFDLESNGKVIGPGLTKAKIVLAMRRTMSSEWDAKYRAAQVAARAKQQEAKNEVSLERMKILLQHLSDVQKERVKLSLPVLKDGVLIFKDEKTGQPRGMTIETGKDKFTGTDKSKFKEIDSSGLVSTPPTAAAGVMPLLALKYGSSS